MDAVDLQQLDTLCSLGSVMRLCDVHDGAQDPDVIGMRHDVDDRGWDSVLAMALWEEARDRHSTFYFLHTAPYWNVTMAPTLREIVALGHEIGLHNNAVAAWWRSNGALDPFDVFEEAQYQLEVWANTSVRSTAGHGDDACYEGAFINYSMFEECPVKSPGFRSFYEVTGMEPRKLREFGLDFAGDHVPRSIYLSDSGDQWSDPVEDVIAAFPAPSNIVILQHPDWYPPGLFS